MNKAARKIFESIKEGSIDTKAGAELLKLLKTETAGNNDDIAIIGIATRLPEAENIEEFWKNIESGRDCIKDFPQNRITDIEPFLESFKIDKNEVKYLKGGYIKDIDNFDNKLFRLTPKEANLMDPNQRIFLETAWQAIDDAGYGQNSLAGSKTGVYVGYNNWPLYKQFISENDPSAENISIPGNVSSIVASRIAYLLDLKGPSMVVDTACSSSLVAIHLACEGIRTNDCSQAIAGGVKITLLPVEGKNQIGIESSDCHTRAFDDAADGTVWGEGAAALLLKPLKQAVKDNDRIYAVIKGTAINQDGSSIGITAPNVLSQADVLIEAWKEAGVDPETISYIETHGTATKLGDPVEVEGIQRAFRTSTSKNQFCAISSVKPNIGHLDSVSGAAGLIKAVLALKNRKLPPTLYFNKPNKKIDFINSPVYVNNRLTEWKTEGYPRRCGVSAFGFSGTNCHIVLEEYCKTENTSNSDVRRPILFTLSTKSKNALAALISNYDSFLENISETELEDVCYSSNLKETGNNYRIALVAKDLDDFRNKIKKLDLMELSSINEPGVYYGTSETNSSKQTQNIFENKLNIAVREITEEYKKADCNREEIINRLAEMFVRGAEINWSEIYSGENRSRIKIPGYPLERRRCWVSLPKSSGETSSVNGKITEGRVGRVSNEAKRVDNKETVKDKIISGLKIIFAETLEMDISEVDVNMSFFETGLDSILLVQIAQRVLDKYNVEVPFGNFFEKLSNIRELAEYIMDMNKDLATAELPEESIQNTDIQSAVNNLPEVQISDSKQTGTVSNDIYHLMEQQLQVINQQMQLLQKLNAAGTGTAFSQKPAENIGNSSGRILKIETKSNDGTYVPYKHIDLNMQSTMTTRQKEYLDSLIKRHNQRTQKSKELTQKYRHVLANNRNVAGFKPQWKEMIYQLVVERGEGARVFDADGRSYIDLTMGFGACLFGHQAPFITERIEEELKRGTTIGPMSHLAGKVAKLVCELTGVDRVAFFNSGTEAVMVALRLARVATGRTKYVMFSGSYHGTFDGILARKHTASDDIKSAPLAPGVSHSMINDVYVLDYGTPESAEFIRTHASELAAVLVEPVQSRKPDFQPREFLQELRSITEKNGIALIFDEVITGFRIHPGGAQAWFGIKSDLVTYGKIAGGTMPIGIVAGKDYFMDGIDGGMWSYGDMSVPPHDDRRTFVAGTFCHHPLAMAAALAALEYLKKQGPELQQELNNRTKRLCDNLNTFYETNRIPMRMVYFGSLFRFELKGDLELLFYSLLEKGIYVWEGRNCFISTAHTDEDIAYIIKSVKESVEELRRGGFIHGDTPFVTGESQITELPATDEQKRLWILSQLGNEESAAYNQSVIFQMTGSVNIPAMQESLNEIVGRHEALRTVFSPDGETQRIIPEAKMELPLIDLSKEDINDSKKYMEQLLKEKESEPFSFDKWPLLRVLLIRLGERQHYMVFIIHHIIADGWSMDVLVGELCSLYESKCRNVQCQLPEPVQYRDYAKWICEDRTEAEQYWQKKFETQISPLILPADHTRSAKKSFRGSQERVTIDTEMLQSLKRLGSDYRCTLYMTLLAGFKVLLHRLTEREDIIVGIPSAGQSAMKAKNLIGQCVNILPVLSSVNRDMTFADYLIHVKKVLLEAFENQSVSLARVAGGMADSAPEGARPFEINIMFNMDRPLETPNFYGLETDILPFPIHYVQYDLGVNIFEYQNKLIVDFDYNTDLFEQATVKCWTGYFIKLLESAAQKPLSSVSALPLMSSNEQYELIDLWNMQ
ncbi:MAG TPA: aminotransferase class III-fold pyridoxal phosphate-dependent enzyme [Ruminiclostridium sp.]|nr:aminotransferase class III-fold pyridoxal phosphate-dependent enzyme [Ruminiclostridium sp.]